MRYSFDTSVLLWLFAKDINHAKRKNAHSLLNKLTKEKKSTNLIIPSPVIAEYLTGFQDRAVRLSVLNDLSRTFEIKSFDIASANFAAEMFIKEKESGHIDQGQKQFIKVDLQILGILKSSNVDIFYCEDEKLLNRAERLGIRASKIPEPDPSFIDSFTF